MPDVKDYDLIGEYARTGSEEAFGELVHRHVDLVYSIAFRVLRNASFAEEVTQRVFVALARNAVKLHEHSRSSIEALFASAPESVRSKYGSADAFILSLFDYPPPDDSRRALNFRILSENTVGDEATVLFEEQFADGHTISGPMRYVRIGNEWRQTLDFDEPSTGKLRTVLQAQTPAPTDPPDSTQPGGK